ncbi:MAG: hypothetical protein KAX49_09300 [Halanaerobiales bacterium]|nr:hypothetical protein [Halanaerobiales bacterium]
MYTQSTVCEMDYVGFYQLARDLNIPIVATGNVHYLRREDVEVYQALRKIQKISSKNYPKKLREEHYLKSPEEMSILFSDLPEALNNSQCIAVFHQIRH